MKRIKLLITFTLMITMLFGMNVSVFAKDAPKKETTKKETTVKEKNEDIYSKWNWYKPGDTKTIQMCECTEDEKKDWEYVKGTEHFYDADFVITNYYVDPEGKDKTTYEIFATLDNSKHNSKKYNTWANADGVIDLEKMADVRDDKNCKVDFVKEKDKEGSMVYYHYVITAPNDMKLAFYYNGGMYEEHKEVKLIGKLYNGLSNGINEDKCVVMRLNPDDENYDEKAGKKSDGFTIRDYKFGDKEKINLLGLKYDSKHSVVKGSEEFFESSFEVTSAKKTENKDGSFDYEVIGLLSTKNFDEKKFDGMDLMSGLLKTTKLEIVDPESKEIKNEIKYEKLTDGIKVTFKVNVPKEQKDNVAIFIVSSVPQNYKPSNQIGDLPNALCRGLLEDDIFFLKLTSDFKDYQKK